MLPTILRFMLPTLLLIHTISPIIPISLFVHICVHVRNDHTHHTQFIKVKSFKVIIFPECLFSELRSTLFLEADAYFSNI